METLNQALEEFGYSALVEDSSDGVSGGFSEGGEFAVEGAGRFIPKTIRGIRNG
jgi:hypothetical protein